MQITLRTAILDQEPESSITIENVVYVEPFFGPTSTVQFTTETSDTVEIIEVDQDGDFTYDGGTYGFMEIR